MYNNHFFDSVAVFSLDYKSTFKRIFMLCVFEILKGDNKLRNNNNTVYL